ncbi:MAG: hypothetical protein AAF481_00745 [Acidobacteriota bacterium]
MSANLCPICKSTGKKSCSSCGGRGGRFARRFQALDFGMRQFGARMQWETCSTCDGSQKVRCTYCNGHVTAEQRAVRQQRAERSVEVSLRALRRTLTESDDLSSSLVRRWLAVLERVEIDQGNPFSEVSALEREAAEEYRHALVTDERMALLELEMQARLLYKALLEA